MEVISNLLQAAVTLLGFFLGGIRYLKSRKQEYFLLACCHGVCGLLKVTDQAQG